MALQVYTASLLKEGLVAYLCMDEDIASWSTDINKAKAVDISDIGTLKSAAERSEKENVIVASYAIDVDVTETGFVPTTKREQIRANGPTILIAQFYAAPAGSTNLQAA